MKALTYLLLTTIKNRIKQLKHNPAQLVLFIFLIAMFGMVLFSAALSSPPEAAARPVQELGVIVLGLYAVIFITACMTGLSSGASFYSMADVNLLFSTPIKQHRILFYGLVRQLGTSLLIGMFILFQYAWLNDTYNVTIPGLFAIFLGYCLTLFCAQLTSMVIYSFTSGNDTLQKQVKVGLYILCAAALAVIAIPVLRAWNASVWPMQSQYTDPRLATAVHQGNSLLLALFPVAGWLKAAVIGGIAGNILPVVLGLAATVGYVAVLVTVIVKTHPDFYEDVLKATEVSFSAITASKQGTMREVVPKNVKVGKTGIGQGSGASVFFYKHRLESRRSRLLILDTTSLLFIAISLVFAFFMRDEGIVPVFVFATYMQVFSSSTGRWLRELILPYVYMIPADPFKKLISVCGESIYKAVFESIAVIVPMGLIVSASPVEIAVCVLARFSFALLFMAGNIVVERLFGQIVSKALIIGLFFLAMLLLALPGVVVGIILGTAFGTAAAMLVITIWNIGASTLIAFLCRDILNYAEMNNK